MIKQDSLMSIVKHNRKSLRLDATGFSILNHSTLPLPTFDKWENVDIVVALRIPTLVPCEIYCVENQVQYIQLQSEIDKYDKIIVEEFQNYYSLFHLTSDENQKAISLDINPQYTHLLTYTFNHFDFKTAENYIVTDIVNDQLALYLFKSSQIQAINYFNVNSLEDILYYILYLADQNGLKQHEFSLLLTKASKEETDFLKKYFFCSNF